MNSRGLGELALEADELSQSHRNIVDAFLRNPAIPLSMYGKLFDVDVSQLSLSAQQKIFDSAVDAEVNECLFWQKTAKDLEKQSFIKFVVERGYKNLPKNR